MGTQVAIDLLQADIMEKNLNDRLWPWDGGRSLQESGQACDVMQFVTR